MDPTALRVRTSLIQFVVRSFNVQEDEINLDESLIQQGIIDSFGLVELTVFIEKDLGVEVREEDMTLEAFGSVNKMARFVAARLESST